MLFSLGVSELVPDTWLPSDHRSQARWELNGTFSRSSHSSFRTSFSRLCPFLKGLWPSLHRAPWASSFSLKLTLASWTALDFCCSSACLLSVSFVTASPSSPHQARSRAGEQRPRALTGGGDGRKTWLWEGSTGSSEVSVLRCADLKVDEAHCGCGSETLGLQSFDWGPHIKGEILQGRVQWDKIYMEVQISNASDLIAIP